MIYLDVVNAFGGEPSATGERFMRVRDDRFPGEEMMIPIAGLDDQPTEAVQRAQARQANTGGSLPLALLPGNPLAEPF